MDRHKRSEEIVAKAFRDESDMHFQVQSSSPLYEVSLWAVFLGVFCMLMSVVTQAEESNDDHVFYGGSKAPWWSSEGLQENLRATLDFSSRVNYFIEENETGFIHAVGFDVHKVFSDDKKDIGVLIAQGYWTRLDNQLMRPGFFENEDDLEFVYRIFNFNYTGFSGNIPNIRIGHMEVAYGLEHTIATNGTLRQFRQPRNLGIKADWGISLNKQHRKFEYEIGVSSGGGQSLKGDSGDHVFSGRIGTPRDENLVLGLSLYKSEIKGKKRKRLGIDVIYYLGRHGILSEFSVGEDESSSVANALLEWNYRSRDESWLYYWQVGYFSMEAENMDGKWVDALDSAIGIKYEPDRHWALSAQVSKELDSFLGGNRKGQVSFQIRYRL